MPKRKYIGGVSVDTLKEMEERHPADFYPTERALIDAYARDVIFDFFPTPKIILDPGAGDGRWGQIFKKRFPNAIIIGTDIRDLDRPDGYDYWFTGEKGNIYNLSETLIFDDIGPIEPDLIIGNPPYSIANDWLKLCFNLVNKEWGLVAFLLSINFMCGERRFKKFYSDEYPISRIIACNTRPSFTENGKTYPGREYGIFHWVFRGFETSYTSRRMASSFEINPISHLVYERNKS